jgi:hypothetical protein
MTSVAQDYMKLMREFLEESISPATFQERYLAQFKAETREMDEGVYQVLDKVFGDLDAFTTDDLLRQRVNKETRRWAPELSQLRQSVESAVRLLEARGSG